MRKSAGMGNLSGGSDGLVQLSSNTRERKKGRCSLDRGGAPAFSDWPAEARQSVKAFLRKIGHPPDFVAPSHQAIIGPDIDAEPRVSDYANSTISSVSVPPLTPTGAEQVSCSLPYSKDSMPNMMNIHTPTVSSISIQIPGLAAPIFPVWMPVASADFVRVSCTVLPNPNIFKPTATLSKVPFVIDESAELTKLSLSSSPSKESSSLSHKLEQSSRHSAFQAKAQFNKSNLASSKSSSNPIRV